MVRQAHLDMAKLFFLLMVLVARLSSMERLLLNLPNLLQGLAEHTAEQFARSVQGSIVDTIRSVLRTEIQERQAASRPIGVDEPSREISEGLPETGGGSGVVKLQFVGVDRPKDPLYTGYPVQWQNGEKAKVAIFRNGKQIMDGDLSKLQIEILPVHADFCTERGLDDFTIEEFNKHIYMSKGKESVLTTVNLTNGEASLGSLCFKESSYNTNLRLAARVKRQDPANRVQEAITDHFVVKDRRSESNEKSDLPSKGDPVHKLKKISQKGKYCIALAGKNITTVKHLMRQYHEDKSGLQKLTGMRKGDWSTMIKHATTCDPGDEIYSYRVAEENCELLFNDLYDLVGVIINGSFIPVRDLHQFQKLKVNNWKIAAYKKFEERENSGGLVPDYLMRNGQPVRAVLLNDEAGPSEQARTAWEYPNDMAAQHGASLTGQQNEYLSSLTTDALGTSSPVTAVERGQHHPPAPQNETPYYLGQRNVLNSQGRSKVNYKSCLPSKGDAVHQLKGISQKGKRYHALTDKNITTVKHLMRQYHKDKSGLQKLTGMKKEEWITMIKHASTCNPGDEIYSYRVAEPNGELLFNDFYDLVGMMLNGQYVPVRDLNQFHQFKVNNWKMSAYKTFEERDNSGGLVPDYLMINGQPVRAVPLNDEAGPSEQDRTAWQYPTDMAAHHGVSLTGQQNEYLSSLTTHAVGTSSPATAVELGQHHPPVPHNGTPYYPTQRNALNGQGPFSGQPTIPSHKLLPIPEEELIRGASLTCQQNGHLSSLMDAPGTSCPVTDGDNQGASSLNPVRADIFSGLYPIEFQWQEMLELQAHLPDQDFIQANNGELPNFNYQFDDYEHDGGNQ